MARTVKDNGVEGKDERNPFITTKNVCVHVHKLVVNATTPCSQPMIIIITRLCKVCDSLPFTDFFLFQLLFSTYYCVYVSTKNLQFFSFVKVVVPLYTYY